MPSIDGIAADYVERAAALDPYFATWAGIAGHDDELPDLSADGFAGRAELDRSTLAALEAAETPGLREQVARAAMQERLAVAVERYDAGDTTSELNVIDSWVQYVRELFDLMPTEGEEGAVNVARRMAAVPEAYRQFSRILLDAARNGRPPARLQVEEVARQCATWKEVTTVYHEGAPGHHLQLSQTLAEQENLNRWQRLMCWVSGSGEGWAFYAERLMGELGYLNDPGAHLGMLDAQLMGAANVALDIGVHLELEIPAGTGWREGERWNAEIAWEFLRAHSSWDEKRLRFELHRYLGWPGQVPSYKLGERIWLQARDEAKARGGDTFSLKDFHTKALSLGAMGLDPLREALARF
jgi:uncharacterized protein (DUF885 family)